MQNKKMPDWNEYWGMISDMNILQEKSVSIDDTLVAIEHEFSCKLLSGDHIQIITALDDRIEQLEKQEVAKKSALQADLFG